MALSRRAFVRSLTGKRSSPRPATPAEPPATPGPRVSPSVCALGREAGHPVPLPTDLASLIYLASTECVAGPGPRARMALAESYAISPGVSHPRLRDADLRAALADRLGATPAAVIAGAGSSELLRSATRAFTSRKAALVLSEPTYAVCAGTAAQIGTPIVTVPVLSDGSQDLEALADAARGAGLLYVANPNNPTGTVHGTEAIHRLVARIRTETADTCLLIDEAYHEYVTDPEYDSAIALALTTPGVIVTRSFSKLHGLAGLRLGYATGDPDTIKTLARHVMPNSVNTMAFAPALAALDDSDHIADERARNAGARTFLHDALVRIGCVVAPSQANFVFAQLPTSAAAFREACAAQGVLVGRDFPPLAVAWTRISVGSLADVKQAALVFERVLAKRHS